MCCVVRVDDYWVNRSVTSADYEMSALVALHNRENQSMFSVTELRALTIFPLFFNHLQLNCCYRYAKNTLRSTEMVVCTKYVNWVVTGE